MARNWFVEPEVVRLDLFDGEGWIEVKGELSHAEAKRLAGGGLDKASKIGSEEVEFGVNLEKYSVERMAIWIIDWSLADKNGKQVKVTRDAIRNLTQPVADEIDRVLTEHVERVEESEKNPPK